MRSLTSDSSFLTFTKCISIYCCIWVCKSHFYSSANLRSSSRDFIQAIILDFCLELSAFSSSNCLTYFSSLNLMSWIYAFDAAISHFDFSSVSSMNLYISFIYLFNLSFSDSSLIFLSFAAFNSIYYSIFRLLMNPSSSFILQVFLIWSSISLLFCKVRSVIHYSFYLFSYSKSSVFFSSSLILQTFYAYSFSQSQSFSFNSSFKLSIFLSIALMLASFAASLSAQVFSYCFKEAQSLASSFSFC